jgi:hypothetical protein
MRNVSLLQLGLLLMLLLCLLWTASAEAQSGSAASTPSLTLLAFRSAFFLITAIFMTPLLLELSIAWVYLRVKKMENRILFSVLVANVASFIIGFLTVIVLSVIISNSALILVLTGGLIILVEAVIIYHLNRSVFKFRQALFFSLLLNIVGLIAQWLMVTYVMNSVDNALFMH